MSSAAPTYFIEQFSEDERHILRRYFSNLDGPVFALVNLPEVVKGALFARYSRSPKSLRRLFLDEFVGELDIAGDETIDATIGLARAEALYDRVFFEYGDDSVAQLGGVHLACEQASNLLTKVLEWGRLMSYLEQSTRYIPYDERAGGRFRYYRDPEILASGLGARYVGDMDRLFTIYGALAVSIQDYFAWAGTLGVNGLLIISSATWCGVCQDEASDLPSMAATFAQKGVKVITLMIEDSYGSPASVATASEWKDAFGLDSIAVVADPNFSFAGFGSVGLPLQIVVDPRTMQIVARDEGFSGSYATVLGVANQNMN